MLDYMAWRNREGDVLLRPRAVKEGESEAPNQYLRALDRIIKDYGKRDVCAEAYLAKAVITAICVNTRKHCKPVMRLLVFTLTTNAYPHCVN